MSRPNRPISQKKLDANRRNAQRSTGPRTPEGKARSSRNATTHGLFCADLLLPGEDEQAFHNIREGLIRTYNPQDLVELLLVDRVFSAAWKLRRLQAAERQRAAVHQEFHRDQRLALRGEFDELKKSCTTHEVAMYCLCGRNRPCSPETMRRRLDSDEGVDARQSASDVASDEALSRLEQRLEGAMHRAMRELARKQAERRKRETERIEDPDAIQEPRSPFLAKVVEVQEEASECEPETAERSQPHAGDGLGHHHQDQTDSLNARTAQPIEPGLPNEPTDPLHHARGK